MVVVVFGVRHFEIGVKPIFIGVTGYSMVLEVFRM